jgi:hypothetical protein
MLFPAYIEYNCDDHTDKNCTSHHVVLIAIWAIGRALSDSAFVTALATVFIAAFTWTLWQSTEKLWLAGKNELAHSEDTVRRQLRAYIGVEADDFAFQIPSEHDPDYEPIDIATAKPGLIFSDFLNVTIRNFGQTPAHDVTVFAYTIYTTPFGSTPPNDWFETIDDTRGRSILSRFVLQPQQSAVSKHFQLNVLPLRQARLRQTSVYVWGHIYYRDIYNRPWRTLFCYAWEPWHVSGQRFVPYEHHNGEDQISYE